MADRSDQAGDPAVGSAGPVDTQFIDLEDGIDLECGRKLSPVRVAYETYGELNAKRNNVILVCHALSGDAHAAGWSKRPESLAAVDGFGADARGLSQKAGLGWWDGMIGPGKGFDTDHYFVISMNLLGGCGGTTGPNSINSETDTRFGSQFPVVTVADMVLTQSLALGVLGIHELFCVSGPSLGGMLALEWAARFPDRVRTVIPIASTASIAPQGLGWNAIARESILSDLNWHGGDYYDRPSGPTAGMAVARMVGHMTYLSAESVASKFGRRLQDRDSVSHSILEADFELESYLRYQGKKFTERFDANTYLLFSRALTYFDLAGQHGGGELEKVASKVRADALMLSFSSDWLYPPENSEALHQMFTAAGQDSEHVCIQAPYGHDSFLLEEKTQTPLIRNFLDKMMNKTK